MLPFGSLHGFLLLGRSAAPLFLRGESKDREMRQLRVFLSLGLSFKKLRCHDVTL